MATPPHPVDIPASRKEGHGELFINETKETVCGIDEICMVDKKHMLKQRKTRLFVKSLGFSLMSGFILALVVTLVVTVWEWLENPGGIFHDHSATNWKFVYATASSWFLPTLAQSAPIIFLVHLIYSAISSKVREHMDLLKK